MPPTSTPTPYSTLTPDPSNIVYNFSLAPDQWQFLGLAALIVVFCVGVLVAVKL